MESLICFQPIAAIPVATSLNKRFGSIYIFLDYEFIAEKETNPDNGKNKIDLGSENARFFEYGLIRGNGFLLTRWWSVDALALAGA